MSTPKYRAMYDGSRRYMVANETGEVVAYFKDLASMEWATQELNTMTWAVETLLKKLENQDGKRN